MSNKLAESLSVEDNLSDLSKANKSIKKGVFLALLSYFLWAVNFTHIKYIQELFYPTFNQFYFVAIRSFSIFLVSYLNLRRKGISLSSIQNLKLKWLFIFRVSANFLAFITLMQMFIYLRIGTASCISSTHPLTVLLFSSWILREPMHFRYIIGLFMSVAGTYLIVNRGHDSAENSNHSVFLGCLFGVIHVSCLGLKLCVNKLLVSGKVDNDLNSAWVGITNGILALLCQFIVGDYTRLGEIRFVLVSFSNGLIFYIAYLTLNMAYYHISANSASAMSYITTFFSFISGILFFGEGVYYTDFLGCALIISFNLYHLTYPIS